jgi:hypothetical protein
VITSNSNGSPTDPIDSSDITNHATPNFDNRKLIKRTKLQTGNANCLIHVAVALELLYRFRLGQSYLCFTMNFKIFKLNSLEVSWQKDPLLSTSISSFPSLYRRSMSPSNFLKALNIHTIFPTYFYKGFINCHHCIIV